MAKAALLAIFAALLALSAALFDAASAARAAMDLDRAALEARPQANPEARDAMFLRAERDLQARWSQPTRWHAGAIEALAWTQALRGRLPQSAATTELAIAQAPVQPAGWLRLAELRRAGVETRLCDTAAACLDKSWTAALAADPELQCARLDLARALGDTPDADDPRVRALIAARPPRQLLAHCLAFLPPEDLFAALGALSRPR
ncbi:MAG: hypothetical protein JNJ73_16460 [Hyphomonadaceae bacterium]|nr:hypothetical protein [Hyphomonadaceae bacterium]